MTALLLLVNALVAILMIILILLQRTDPASGGVFGGTGGGNQPIIRNPLARPTAFLAAVFLINCLAIAYLTKGHENANSIMVAPAPVMPGTVSATVALPELPAALGGSGSNLGKVAGGSPTVPAAGSRIVSATAK
jgi:preprotein translocase subunit SecG